MARAVLDFFLGRLRSDDARTAFAQRDSDLSKSAHDAAAAQEKHLIGGEYTKSVVYGGLDGIITTFAIVAACEGGALGGNTLICLGLSNLIADGLSMGIGDWVSEKAEQDLIATERAREKWEFDNFPAGEVAEMTELYMTKYGVAREDAATILGTMHKYGDLFVDHMMAVELELLPAGDPSSAMRKGGVTFCSFVGFGSVPLLAMVSSTVFELAPRWQFRLCCIVTAVCIYLLGAGRGHITHQNVHSAGLTMLLTGGSAALSAYYISQIAAAYSQDLAAPVCLPP